MKRTDFHLNPECVKAEIIEFTLEHDADVIVNMPAPPPGQKRPNPLETMPTLIIVFGQDDMFTTIYDCTLAMGNMMIAATSLGIGSNWVHAVVKGLFNSEEGKTLKKEWEVPDEYIPYAAAVFGYKAAEPMPRLPRKGGVVKII